MFGNCCYVVALENDGLILTCILLHTLDVSHDSNL